MSQEPDYEAEGYKYKQEVVRIFEVAKHNNMVGAIFETYRLGHRGWEESLVLMVEKLAEMNKRQLEMIYTHQERCTNLWIYTAPEPVGKEEK